MCTSFCLVLSVCLSLTVTATAKSLQLCPTLCDPIDDNPPGAPVPGIPQAKYWTSSFSISPSNEHSGLISLKIVWFDLLALQRTLRSLLQHQFEDINSLVLCLLYGPACTTSM